MNHQRILTSISSITQDLFNEDMNVDFMIIITCRSWKIN